MNPVVRPDISGARVGPASRCTSSSVRSQLRNRSSTTRGASRRWRPLGDAQVALGRYSEAQSSYARLGAWAESPGLYSRLALLAELRGEPRAGDAPDGASRAARPRFGGLRREPGLVLRISSASSTSEKVELLRPRSTTERRSRHSRTIPSPSRASRRRERPRAIGGPRSSSTGVPRRSSRSPIS